MLLFSCANENFLFWHLSNDCQIVRPALVSGPPNRKKPYNKHLISLVVSVRTVNYGSSFFSHRFDSVRNLQYGPKTRLIRGSYCRWDVLSQCFHLSIYQACVPVYFPSRAPIWVVNPRGEWGRNFPVQPRSQGSPSHFLRLPLSKEISCGSWSLF